MLSYIKRKLSERKQRILHEEEQRIEHKKQGISQQLDTSRKKLPGYAVPALESLVREALSDNKSSLDYVFREYKSKLWVCLQEYMIGMYTYGAEYLTAAKIAGNREEIERARANINALNNHSIGYNRAYADQIYREKPIRDPMPIVVETEYGAELAVYKKVK